MQLLIANMRIILALILIVLCTYIGSSKKEAKNQAAKQAVKQFLNCDLDEIAAS